MDTKVVGRCKKEIVENIPFYSDRDDFITEFKVPVGKIVSLDGNTPLWGEEKDEYSFFLHYRKIKMTRAQVEEHFEIVWEKGCYNTCIRDGVPCKELHSYRDGHVALTKSISSCCGIGWEIGRGDCRAYEALNK